jgi:hypothetical protein
MAVAPGMDWQSTTPSLNVSSSSHLYRATDISLMYATIAGPPKAVTPSLRKEKNSFPMAGLLLKNNTSL